MRGMRFLHDCTFELFLKQKPCSNAPISIFDVSLIGFKGRRSSALSGLPLVHKSCLFGIPDFGKLRLKGPHCVHLG